MKEKLLNNLGLKIISLVFAFIVWMAIVNISNPIVSDDCDVVLEVKNGNALESRNLTYEINGKSTINVKYNVRARDQSLIRASDFHAYIDLKDYNVTEAIPVTVEISKEKESLIVEKENITAKPMVVRIKTENLQRKQFALGVKVLGETEDGYALGTVTLSPETVWVKGPESQIGKINSMGIEIDIAGANADRTDVTQPLFYDANGKQFELDAEDKVVLETEEVAYTVSILKAKSLNLTFDVHGEVAGGYRFTGVESDIKQVPVVGTKSVLASLSTLSISDDALNITGATQDKVVVLDVNDYLPPSTSLAGDTEGTVKVTLKIEPLITRIFSVAVADLEKKGTVADYEYSFSENKIDVTVRGLEEDLDTLELKDLNTVLDVEGLKQGTYPAKLLFDVGEGFEIADYTDFEVTVVSDGEDTDASTSQAEESGSTSAAVTAGSSADTSAEDSAEAASEPES